MIDLHQERLARRIEQRTAVAGVIGLGYIGLPLAVALAHSGYRTIGLDVNESLIARINAGGSHIKEISGAGFARESLDLTLRDGPSAAATPARAV